MFKNNFLLIYIYRYIYIEKLEVESLNGIIIFDILEQVS